MFTGQPVYPGQQMYAVPGAVTRLPSRVSYVTSGAEIPGGMAAPAVAYPQMAPQIYAPSAMVSPRMQTQTRVVTLSVPEAEVLLAQKAWSDAIKHISKTYLEGGDYVAAAAKAAGELYGYGHTNVLFKPTKAAEAQFRPTASDAMSYFVGHKAVEKGYLEDAGFAINGGKGWSNVVFDNHQIDVTGNVAIAMGNYFFTSAADGSKTKVEYTFGYKKNADGKVRIFLHHSSVPYSVPAATKVQSPSLVTTLQPTLIGA